MSGCRPGEGLLRVHQRQPGSCHLPRVPGCPEPTANQSGSLGKHAEHRCSRGAHTSDTTICHSRQPVPLASETPPDPLPRTASKTQGTSSGACRVPAVLGGRMAVRNAASASSQPILGPGFELTCPCPPPGSGFPCTQKLCPAWWYREVFPWQEGQLFQTEPLGCSCRLAVMETIWGRRQSPPFQYFHRGVPS